MEAGEAGKLWGGAVAEMEQGRLGELTWEACAW